MDILQCEAENDGRVVSQREMRADPGEAQTVGVHHYDSLQMSFGFRGTRLMVDQQEEAAVAMRRQWKTSTLSKLSPAPQTLSNQCGA